MGRAAEVILEMRLKGIKLWSENGRLHYKTSGGDITRADITKLAEAKAEIMSILDKPSPESNELQLVRRDPTEKVLLTFSQQAWWNSLGLEKHPSNRSVFTAVRLLGPLNVHYLKQAFAEIVQHHVVLRTVIVTMNGIRQQCISEDSQYILEVVNLPTIPKAEREATAERMILELITEPVDVSVGPLFAAKLIAISSEDHVLAVALDHLISDAFSMGILQRDIWTLYSQLQQGIPFHLPRQPVQFADYAVWQHKSHHSWTKKHHAYWADRLSGARQVSLFERDTVVEGAKPSLASLSIDFGKELSEGLRNLGRHERTTLAMTVLCAYSALAFCWCDITDLVVPFVTMGRSHLELERVVGFFGYQLFLRFDLHESDNFLDLLRRISTEYASAYEHQDSGRVSAQMPRPEFASNFGFNWYPSEYHLHSTALTAFIDNAEVPGIGEHLKLQPFTFQNALRNVFRGDAEAIREGGLQLTSSEDGISGALWYRTDCVTPASISRFRGNLILFAERLLREPHKRVKECAVSS